MLLLSMLPMLGFIALLIRATSYGPLIVTDTRIRDGQTLHLLRFRTTGSGTPEFRLIARLLRWSHFDELPAFWNVVRGHITHREISLFT